MSASTIPAAITALVEVATNAIADQPKFVVYDGPPRPTTAQGYVAIGYMPSTTGERVVEATSAIRGLSVARNQESYDIAGQASFWQGAGDISDVRETVFAVLDAIAAALEADKTMGRAVMQAVLSVTGYEPTVPSAGPTVTADFLVHIEAMRR